MSTERITTIHPASSAHLTGRANNVTQQTTESMEKTMEKKITRKEFLAHGVNTGIVVLVGASSSLALGACAPEPEKKRQVQFRSLDEAAREFEAMEHAVQEHKAITLSGAWNLVQHLAHCSQSIEFSMQGFPEQKSAVFQKTAGALAFAVFKGRGAMSHNTNEPIPGAEALSPNAALEAAFKRLSTALDAFKHYDRELAPHFAYGQLTKGEYTIAHTMHLADHAARMRY
jgi:hypothetical protein